MKIFLCQTCEAVLFFENTTCLSCGHELGFLPDRQAIGALEPVDDGRYRVAIDGSETAIYRKCGHYARDAVCNWMIPQDDDAELCSSCRLTHTIPDLSVPGNRERWARLEAAKRRLCYGLSALGLPVYGTDAADQPTMRFEFLADTPAEHVLTGHRQGVITINVAEADDVIREEIRTSLGESYRTLLGHLRHESGHFFWDRLIGERGAHDAFRSVFGDEREDYAAASRRHYSQGAPPDWQQRYVSAYASMHPWEDWAETWTHYLHMVDAVEIGGQFGLSLSSRSKDPSGRSRRVRLSDRPVDGFDALLDAWFPLTYAVNSLNRGMGLHDWYPFTLSDAALTKLRFVHQVLEQERVQPAAFTPTPPAPAAPTP